MLVSVCFFFMVLPSTVLLKWFFIFVFLQLFRHSLISHRENSFPAIHRCTAGNLARGYAENLRAALISLRCEHVAASADLRSRVQFSDGMEAVGKCGFYLRVTYAPFGVDSLPARLTLPVSGRCQARVL